MSQELLLLLLWVLLVHSGVGLGLGIGEMHSPAYLAGKMIPRRTKLHSLCRCALGIYPEQLSGCVWVRWRGLSPSVCPGT